MCWRTDDRPGMVGHRQRLLRQAQRQHREHVAEPEPRRRARCHVLNLDTVPDVSLRDELLACDGILSAKLLRM